jgi:hypothetical protein
MRTDSLLAPFSMRYAGEVAKEGLHMNQAPRFSMWSGFASAAIGALLVAFLAIDPSLLLPIGVLTIGAIDSVDLLVLGLRSGVAFIFMRGPEK